MALTHLPDVAAAAAWLSERVSGELRTDSRQVAPGDAFIAWPGYATDGRLYVQAALNAGASACLVEADGLGAFEFEDPRVAVVTGLKAATGDIADLFYRQPSRHLRVAAVTGTNGKTSSAWWIAQSLSQLGQRCGIVGTLGVGEPPRPGRDEGQIRYTGLTTPDPVVLQQGFARMVADGFAACAIEASSIGIVEQRLVGTAVEVALFTNFTQDHIDYHGSMAAYRAAKRALFDWPGLKAAVLNVDDPVGAGLVAELAGKGLDLWTTSVGQAARLQARELVWAEQGLAFVVVEGAATVSVQTQLIGDYNVHNLLGVIATLRAMGVPLADAAAAAARVSPVPGRMQRLPAVDQAPEVVVDYAHTPDALDKALAALRPMAEARGGQLWCVFGCGGDRDPVKRPLMGEVAVRLADRVIVTSDNPRSEDPEAIVAQIVAGVGADAAVLKLGTEVDRRLAILEALAAASPRDVLLIAGKGHEDYQEIAGVRHAFSDLAVAAAGLSARSHA